MKFMIEVDTDRDNACIVGEALRSKFWDQRPDKNHPQGKTGFYSTFDFNPDVEVLPNQIEYRDHGPYWESEIIRWQRAKWNNILFRGFWDGDGYMEFVLPDGSTLVNSDAKKDYEWTWSSDIEISN